MRKKLTNSDYSSADEFHADFKLMMKNCYTFNPVNTAVHEAGRSLEAVFDQKWQGLPPLHHDASDESEESEEEDDEQARIAELESQIEHMNRTLEGLKKDKSKTKKKEKKPKQEKPPVPSTSKPAPKPAKAAPPKPSTKKNNKRPIADDDVLSFEQKKDLSDTIAKLDGTKLERVIQIIHEGVPEIRDVRYHSLVHAIVIYLRVSFYRALKRSSSKLISYLLPSSRSCTTLSFVLCVHPHRNDHGPVRVPEPAV